MSHTTVNRQVGGTAISATSNRVFSMVSSSVDDWFTVNLLKFDFQIEVDSVSWPGFSVKAPCV